MTTASDIVTTAREAAESAASAAGVVISEPRTIGELEQVGRFLDSIWDPDGDVVPLELLKALVHAGNQVLSASADGAVVGAAVAFFGRRDGDLHLHSHVVGVARQVRSRNVGIAIKLAQRCWALVRGIDHMTWTFDPLVAANAYFNLVKLGAEGHAYLPDFYGVMHDAFHSGEETDRVEISWELSAPEVEAAAAGRRSTVDIEGLVSARLPVVLDEDPSGHPVPAAGEGHGVLLARIPPDILGMRRRDPALAAEWPRALRETVGKAMDDGYRIVGFGRPGWYVLSRKRRVS